MFIVNELAQDYSHISKTCVGHGIYLQYIQITNNLINLSRSIALSCQLLQCKFTSNFLKFKIKIQNLGHQTRRAKFPNAIEGGIPQIGSITRRT
jgi:hypothetical protein